jgi:hypothetical protein
MTAYDWIHTHVDPTTQKVVASPEDEALVDTTDEACLASGHFEDGEYIFGLDARGNLTQGRYDSNGNPDFSEEKAILEARDLQNAMAAHRAKKVEKRDGCC